MRSTLLPIALTLSLTPLALSSGGDSSYSAEVILSGLEQPTGIAVRGNKLYFTELPTPGVPGTMGGTNRVQRYNLNNGNMATLTIGEPEPTNISPGPAGSVLWTCKSAGVILRRDNQGNVAPFLTGLDQPSGISVGRQGVVYFTQIPTPGVPGTMGGENTVNVSDGTTTSQITLGEPEPTDIVTTNNGRFVFWTCKSAGVILRANTNTGDVSLVLDNLAAPTGIAISRNGRFLYFTEVPTPGVPGSMGGTNRVMRYDLATGDMHEINAGDPEPTDITVAPDGTVYWTCTSAGVVVRATLQ